MLKKGFRWSKGERTFAIDVATFMSGRGVAAAISFLLTPVVARLFSPEHWGVAALYIAICGAIGPISGLHYQRAIPIADTDDEALDLFRLFCTIAMLVAVASVLAVVAVVLTSWSPAPIRQLGYWIWLVPVGIALEGLTTGLQAWVLRFRRFRALSSGEIAQVVARTGPRIGIGAVFGSSLAGLAASHLLGYVAMIGTLLTACVGAARLKWKPIRLRELTRLAQTYRDFPIYNASTGLLMQVTRQLPLFVLASAFGPAAAGFFGMADRLVRTPVNVTSDTIRQVLLHKAAETRRAGRSIRPGLIKTVVAQIVVVLPMAILVWFYAEPVIVLLLGQEWRPTGEIVALLAPYLFVQFLSPPFQAVATVTRQQRLWFSLQTFSALSRLIIIPCAIFLPATPTMIVSIYVWTTVVTQTVMIIVMFSRMREFESLSSFGSGPDRTTTSRELPSDP